ncbi:MAG: hypothetical protein GY841_02755 [FCB group bacterium]|nr:hypothetical protein [FCB group bacterium]
MYYESFDESFDDSFDGAMATTVDKQSVTAEGLNPTMTAAAASGDTFSNFGRKFFILFESTAGEVVVTIKTEKVFDGDLELEDQEFTVPALGRRLAGPFSRSPYNNDNSNINVTYDDATGLNICALDLSTQLPAYPAYPAKVFLLAGQSNMVGSGTTADLESPYDQALGRVKMWNGSAWISYDPNDSAVFGPEVGIAHALTNEYPAEDIYLIKHAIGSTGLMQDLAGNATWNIAHIATNTSPSFPIYDFVQKTDAAIAAIPVEYTIDGMFWMQGEEDAERADDSAAYYANLTALIANMRSTTNHSTWSIGTSPFIVGLTNVELSGRAYETVVRAAQIQVCIDFPEASWWVNTDDMEDTGVHYSTAGYLALGLAMGAKLINQDFDCPTMARVYDNTGFGADGDITTWTDTDGANSLIIDSSHKPVATTGSRFGGEQFAAFPANTNVKSDIFDFYLSAFRTCTFVFALDGGGNVNEYNAIMRSVNGNSDFRLGNGRSGVGPVTHQISARQYHDASGYPMTVTSNAPNDGPDLPTTYLVYRNHGGDGGSADLVMNDIANKETVAGYNKTGDTVDLGGADVYIFSMDGSGYEMEGGGLAFLGVTGVAMSDAELSALFKYLGSRFGKPGDTIQALFPAYYAKAEVATLDGGSWEFNGTNSVATVSDPGDTTLDLPDGDWSIVTWVRFNGNTGAALRYCVSMGDAPPNANSFNLWAEVDGTLKFTVSDGGGDYVEIACTESPASDTDWHHVAVIRSGNTFTGYLDGIAGTGWNATDAAVDGIDVSAGNEGVVTFGNRCDGASRYFAGSLRDFAIFNDRAISGTELASLVANGSPDDVSGASPDVYIPMTDATSSDGAHTIDGLTVTNANITGSDDGARVTELTNLANEGA